MGDWVKAPPNFACVGKREKGVGERQYDANSPPAKISCKDAYVCW